MPVECICQQINCGKIFFTIPAEIRKGGGKYCSIPCRASAKKRSLLERLTEKIQICMHGPTCPYCHFWWTAGTNKKGYGTIMSWLDDKPKNNLAHRLVWQFFHNRPIPIGLNILHHCDIPACCNVFHLYVGTLSDNIRDAYRRNRRHTVPPVHRGEDHWKTTLKAADIPLIFQWHREGIRIQVIADLLHITDSTVDNILGYRSWTHISRNL